MENKELTIIELCLSPDLGGLELYMFDAVRYLDDNCKVVSVIRSGSKLEHYYDESQTSYLSINKQSNILMLGAAKKLAKHMDECRADIVHLHWTKDIPLVVLAKWLSRSKPAIVQTRHMRMTRFKNDFYHKWLYKNIEMILAVTHQVADELERYIPKDVRPRIEMIHPGVKLLAQHNTETIQHFKEQKRMNGALNVGMVGRIEEAKGQHLLIEAVSMLRDEGVEVNAFFVGSSMQEGYIASLQAKATKLNIASSIHFLGFMKDPSLFMQACDLTVLATPCETFGLVVLESMAVGTPVLATDKCGPLEIIKNNKDGLLFLQDDVESLCQCMLSVYHDQTLLKTLSFNGKTKVLQNFEQKKQFSMVLAKLKKLV